MLREKIGKSFYVYDDDVIIFSESMEEHVKHITWVLDQLSQFFRVNIDYLGFMVSRGGISTNPSKIGAINKFLSRQPCFMLDHSWV